MPVNGPVMPVAQAARWNVLVGARAGNFFLEGIEPGLIAKPEAILEDGRAGIAIWVGNRGIHERRHQPFRWMAIIARTRSAVVRPWRSNSAARCFISEVSRIPSTALMAAKAWRPMRVPTRLPSAAFFEP